MNLKKRTIKYDYTNDISSLRNAIIIFTTHSSKWKLERVDFETNNNPYDYEDWQFLRDITNKIDELLEGLNGVKDYCCFAKLKENKSIGDFHKDDGVTMSYICTESGKPCSSLYKIK